ncbi:ultraviolet-B receptor UVR8 isoform X2 [Magnolia sinica]|uniref:ultraviolet-B receptor UVR8 isoform X2 n=1 Tax=Magnolia sinica TaxID=86752 RepID=UPI0026587E68|nr:ultraviolet-B receptor UVR8 isoform X2 [Magnolia sinica]
MEEEAVSVGWELMEDEEEEEEEERVWSWGAGTDGQLGTGSANDHHLPQQLPLSPSSAARPISHIACGGAHAIALLQGGRVLTWGRGNCGQLGHGDLLNSLKPKLVEFFKNIVICHVSAGWNHSGFVSDTGCLFTCGDGSFGQLGHGDCQSHSSPIEVLFFNSKHVVQIECGMRHSLTLSKGTSGDSLHGFGSGRRGQLGISTDRKSRSFAVPQAIYGLEDVEIASICANGDHSVALSANGNLYIWGRGFGGASDAYCPQLLPSPLKFSQVAVGWNHALLLTDSGEVFMLGGNHHGMLSNSQQMSHEQQSPLHCTPSTSSHVCNTPLIPMRVPGLNGKKVLVVAAGAEHSAIVTENGTVMTWGWGEHGQLGLGNTFDQTSPQIVRLTESGPSDDHGPLRVYCGSGFTIAGGPVSSQS